MNTTEVIRLGREAMVMVLILGGPVLLTSVVIGSTVALLQAVTQVHEATLTFLPKLLGAMLILATFGGWMIELTVGYTARTFHYIPTIGE